MGTRSDRVLVEFVNREEEIERFRQMVRGEGPRLFCIRGEGGVGKSSLQAVMVHEVSQRRMRKAEVVWTASRNYDYLGIMRKVRDDVGGSAFEPLTDLINYFTVPTYNLRFEGRQDISILEHGKLDNSQITGDVAGVLIKDMMLVYPRGDKAITEMERLAQLTDQFLECLKETRDDGDLVLFFDATEKMGQETQRWLWEELFGWICHGDPGGVYAVVCGRDVPALDRGWEGVADVADLQGLPAEKIVTYLERRGFPEEHAQVVAKTLAVTSAGNMLKLATDTDTLIRQLALDGNG